MFIQSLTQSQTMFPKQISHYAIIKKLGEGGMGEVYLAEDNRLGRQVAIKFLPQELAKDQEHLRRFHQEARVISTLNHPNIISIYDVGETDFGHFIVMELISGQTLREYYNQLPNHNLINKLGEQIASALSAAHKQKIIHRDIKPENIMVRNDGYIKLLDFGLARFTHPNASSATIVKTQTGVILGTVTHMSPEQTQAVELTSATDIFSLGVIFYELATGENPFEANSMIGYLNKINSQQPIKPSHINPQLPTRLEALIMQMLEKDSRLRPTASEIEKILSTDIKNVTRELPNLSSITLDESKTSSKSIIGRDKEYQEISIAWETVLQTQGQMLSITGEAGMGKTFLVEEFLSSLKNNKSLAIAYGHSSERLAGTEAYLPFLEALIDLLHGQTREIAAQIMKAFAPSWYLQVMPALTGTNLSHQLTGSKALSQEKMKFEMVSFLQEFSQKRPLILFFEDLHWADISTIDLLIYLGSLKFQGMKLLIIITYRASDMLIAKHPFLSSKAQLQRYNIYREIPLHFLTQTNIEQYLGLKFVNNKFPKEFSTIIYNKTQGNPLFITDLLSYLSDSNIIIQTQEGWLLTPSISEIDGYLPESIRSLIDRKLEQLSEEERRLLAVGSIQGNEFDSAVLARVLNLEPSEVEESLEKLAKTFLLIELIKETEFPDYTLTSRYRFIQLLYQDVLYQSWKPSRRLSIAASIAQALEEFYGKKANTIASQLANLYETARKFAKSADYYLLAAKNAAKMFANQEVIALAKKGLAQLEPLVDEERLTRELALDIMLGFALSVTKGYAAKETGESFNKAHKICQQLGDNPQLFPIIWGLELYYTVKAQYQISRQYTEKLLRMAQASQNPMELIAAHYALGVTLQFLGEIAIGHQHLEKSILLHEIEKSNIYSIMYGLDPGIYSRFALIRSLLIMGYSQQAEKQLNETLSLVKSSSQPRNFVRAQMSAIIFSQFHHDAIKAQQLTQECIAHCLKHGLLQEQEWMKVILGWTVAAQGNVDLGISQMKEQMLNLKVESECTFSTFYALLAEVLCQSNRILEGLEVAIEGLEMTQRTGETFYQAELYRVKGDLLFKQAKTDINKDYLITQAEECILESIKIAQTQQAKAWELRACISLVTISKKTGKLAIALEKLRSIYQWFTEGFNTPDLVLANQIIKNHQ